MQSLLHADVYKFPGQRELSHRVCVCVWVCVRARAHAGVGTDRPCCRGGQKGTGGQST